MLVRPRYEKKRQLTQRVASRRKETVNQRKIKQVETVIRFFFVHVAYVVCIVHLQIRTLQLKAVFITELYLQTAFAY